MGLENLSEVSTMEELQQYIQNELDQTKRGLKEISLMLDQSQVELNKLTQRNANITVHLQQIQTNLDTVPRQDIRMAYTQALDAQQRLLVMRSQLEKLQSDQAQFQRYQDILNRFYSVLLDGVSGVRQSKGGMARTGSAALEQVINAQEVERQRLSRQMHDGPAQALSNFIVQVEIASRMFEIDEKRAKDELSNLKTAAMSTFQKVRTFISELRPMMLDDLGLIPTLKRYVDNYREETGYEVTYSVKGVERRLPTYLEVMVFRAVQEMLRNVSIHNQDHPGKLRVDLQLNIDESSIRVSVNDNGKGFDVEQLEQSSGFGLKLIRERVEMLGGTLEIDSAVGQGSRVGFQVPAESVS